MDPSTSTLADALGWGWPCQPNFSSSQSSQTDDPPGPNSSGRIDGVDVMMIKTTPDFDGTDPLTDGENSSAQRNVAPKPRLNDLTRDNIIELERKRRDREEFLQRQVEDSNAEIRRLKQMMACVLTAFLVKRERESTSKFVGVVNTAAKSIYLCLNIFDYGLMIFPLFSVHRCRIWQRCLLNSSRKNVLVFVDNFMLYVQELCLCISICVKFIYISLQSLCY